VELLEERKASLMVTGRSAAVKQHQTTSFRRGQRRGVGSGVETQGQSLPIMLLLLLFPVTACLLNIFCSLLFVSAFCASSDFILLSFVWSKPDQLTCLTSPAGEEAGRRAWCIHRRTALSVRQENSRALIFNKLLLCLSNMMALSQ
jgi:hypothetical protein